VANNLPLGPLMVDIGGHELAPEDIDCLCHPLVGGVILFSRNFHDQFQLTELVASIHALRSPRLLVAVDQEGGRVQRLLDGFTRLPSARSLGRCYEEDKVTGELAAFSAGYVMAFELRTIDIDISFSPVLDLFNPLSSVIGSRAFSSDPGVVGVLADQVVRGMNLGGMCGVAKHFPGHGGVVGDSHTELPSDPRSLKALQAADLVPYERLLPRGYAGVMVAHVVFPAVDGSPASLSARWLNQELRGRLDFDGVIFCDDIMMGGAVAALDSVGSRAQLALSSGCDVVLVCNDRLATNEVIRTLESETWVNPQVNRLSRLAGGAIDQTVDVEQCRMRLAGMVD
jgi:beta-N-acetylhexosaminidase